MVKKSDRRVQFTKMILREALLDLMKEKPIGKITPTELCRVADINRNTFYAHYTTPADLLAEIEDELYNEIIDRVEVYEGSVLNLKDLCCAIRDRAELCRILFSDHGDWDFLLKLMSSVHDISIAGWKKLAPNATIEELESFFAYCANGSVAVIREWINGGMKMTAEQVAKVLESANSSVLTALGNRGRITVKQK